MGLYHVMGQLLELPLVDPKIPSIWESGEAKFCGEFAMWANACSKTAERANDCSETAKQANDCSEIATRAKENGSKLAVRHEADSVLLPSRKSKV